MKQRVRFYVSHTSGSRPTPWNLVRAETMQAFREPPAQTPMLKLNWVYTSNRERLAHDPRVFFFVYFVSFFSTKATSSAFGESFSDTELF